MSDKNWIITDKGDHLNLNFFSKIIWGGYFMTVDQPTKGKPLYIYLFHGTAGLSGSIAYIYETADDALIAYRKYTILLESLGIVADMRSNLKSNVTVVESLDSIDVNSFTVSTTGNVVNFNGFTLNPYATITSDGGVFSALLRRDDGTMTGLFAAGATPGTYDIVYTSAGIVNVLKNVIQITP
jgi:hypothetical protein